MTQWRSETTTVRNKLVSRVEAVGGACELHHLSRHPWRSRHAVQLPLGLSLHGGDQVGGERVPRDSSTAKARVLAELAAWTSGWPAVIERSNVSSPTLYVPGRHQVIGSQYLIDHQRCMLVADPGLGKTGMTLQALDLLKLCGSNFFPALVLAPKRVADVVWTGERDKWLNFQDLSMVKVLGEREQRLHSLRQSVADIYVCNYENVEWLTSQWSQEKWPFKTVIADESSKLKGFRIQKGRKRAHALSNIAQFTGRWWNLTGTPAPNGLQDLWGQMYFVDFGERLKRSYTPTSRRSLWRTRTRSGFARSTGARRLSTIW